MIKAIKLIRIKDNKKHITILYDNNCLLHIELIEKLFNRLLNKNILIDIDYIIDNYYISKGYIDNKRNYIESYKLINN